MKLSLSLALCAAPLLRSQAAVCTVFTCPTIPYRSAEDNPFRAGVAAGTMFLEDFEDGRLNTPFVDEEESGGGAGRSTLGMTQFLAGENNSVDGDDGVIDAADILGVGWMGPLRGLGSISFVFEPRILPDGRRQYPTWFGFAVTAGYAGSNTTVRFTDEQESLLGQERLPAGSFPEYDAGQRGVATDRFVSFYVPTGAEIMHINGTIYTIDHLTYGWDPIPEPGTATLAVLPLLLMMMRHRRKLHR